MPQKLACGEKNYMLNFRANQCIICGEKNMKILFYRDPVEKLKSQRYPYIRA